VKKDRPDDNIKMFVKEIEYGGAGWIQLDEGRDQ
jgi:hypothetical protein